MKGGSSIYSIFIFNAIIVNNLITTAISSNVVYNNNHENMKILANFLYHHGLLSSGNTKHRNSTIGWPSYSFVEYLNLLSTTSNMNNYTVNIGANNGVDFDPVYPLLQKGFAGLMIEGF